ncbi:hypothetical protein HPP92_003543 [Vanilla planifolia]|uniref:RING-type E3 ubiquitin transferase n=1 Tax=Vanilla planifolia TaxID=51239 RepID=A0A835VNR3_VANPL|nr:hypothetical protein HPP92_003543 [Vanilla planifolia]
MSGGQATELRELERTYGNVMDENSRVYAGYLKEVLRSGDLIRPPELDLPMFDGIKIEIEAPEDEIVRDDLGSTHGRFNPVWVETDQSMELSADEVHGGQCSYTRASSLVPQRVTPQRLLRKPSYESMDTSRSIVSGSGESFASVDDYDDSSSEPEPEPEPDMEEEEQDREQAVLRRNRQYQRQRTTLDSFCSSSLAQNVTDKIFVSSKQAPPKDFICPITGHLFDDPVTLETGQTYERVAIQEWLDQGNMTCPITRQKLHSTKLPKTNFVFKRLIVSWQEQNAYSSTTPPLRSPSPVVARRPSRPKRLPSPTSVITQASGDFLTGDLRYAITCLCTSDVTSEAEMAVLQIERLWRENGSDPGMLSILSKVAVINGFVEILFNSIEMRVLRTAVFLLCELASKDKHVIQTLTRIDSNLECMAALFKKGIVEAIVLIYLLHPSSERLIAMDMVEAVFIVLKNSEDDSSDMFLKQRAACILLLQQILSNDHKTPSGVVNVLVSEGVVEGVIPSLLANTEEERMAAISIILRCMEVDGKCRQTIFSKASLETILEDFASVGDMERFEIVQFLFELVKLERRTTSERLLLIIKDGGKFSMMHALLVYLQTALQDQSPIIAGLLLQLDILVEPRKASIYREEAIDALISCLRNPDFHNSQLLTAETILSLQGRFSYSGEPIVRASLLKRAGMKRRNISSTGSDQINHVLDDSKDNEEEDKAADEWERKMAFVLVSHEFGLMFETLAECLKSEQREFFSACLVSASWLTYMLSILPDTGLRGAARGCLLKHFISILKSAKHADDKALAMLALKSFIQDPECLHELTFHMKDIIKTLRELKKSFILANEMLKLLCHGQESCLQEIWNHKVLVQVDCSMHGEVLSIAYFKNRIISGHTDGTIKVWGCGEKLLHQVQEAREHTKAVTSFAILPTGKLCSGSVDKSLRVWSLHDGLINCKEVHDTKDQVHNLAITDNIACFISQGAGVKLLSWNGASKIVNPNKYVRCLSLFEGKLYCGCNDNSIQEIDLATGTSSTIQAGNRKLLAKANPVHALEVKDGLVYSVCSPLDGAAVKICSASDYRQVGSLPSTLDVRCLTISAELIYLGTKTGVVELWSRNKLVRVGVLQIGSNCRVTCMIVFGDEVLVVGTSDGRLQAWGLT